MCKSSSKRVAGSSVVCFAGDLCSTTKWAQVGRRLIILKPPRVLPLASFFSVLLWSETLKVKGQFCLLTASVAAGRKTWTPSQLFIFIQLVRCIISGPGSWRCSSETLWSVLQVCSLCRPSLLLDSLPPSAPSSSSSEEQTSVCLFTKLPYKIKQYTG